MHVHTNCLHRSKRSKHKLELPTRNKLLLTSLRRGKLTLSTLAQTHLHFVRRNLIGCTKFSAQLKGVPRLHLLSTYRLGLHNMTCVHIYSQLTTTPTHYPTPHTSHPHAHAQTHAYTPQYPHTAPHANTNTTDASFHL